MCIPLLDYVNPVTRALDLPSQIQRLAAALYAKQRRWVALDFSGVMGVSQAFNDAFVQVLDAEFPETWLVPRHYDARCQSLVSRLLSRLRRQRDSLWCAACHRWLTAGE